MPQHSREPSGGRFFVFLALAGAALFLVGALLQVRWWPRVAVEPLRFSGPQGTLVARLWHPPSTPVAGVLLCHGVEANKEVMSHLAAELARRGVLALAFDYGGYGESDEHGDALSTMVADSAAALAELAKRLPPGAPLGAIGHSMGATYAVELAHERPEISAVVALGNEPVAEETPPRNVLYGVGSFDAFHSLDAMLATVRESSGKPKLAPFELAGAFASGSARKLVVSPVSDHGIEPLDAVLMGESIAWLAAALPAPSLAVPQPLSESDRAAAYIVAFFGLTLLLLAGAVGALAACAKQATQKVLARAPIGLFAAFALAGSLDFVAGSPVWADCCLAILLAGAGANALVVGVGDHPLAVARTRLLRTSAALGGICLCLLVGVIAGGLPALWQQSQLEALPSAALHVLALRPYEGLCMVRAYAFHHYSVVVVPGVILAALLATETLRPGSTLSLAARAVATLLRALELRGPVRLHTSRRAVLLLATLVGMLGYVLLRRFQEGWLSWEALRRMGSISLTSMLLPLGLLIVALNIRARWLRRPPR